MMARKKRNYLSRDAVKQRRDRVLELRLAGLSPSAIAGELGKEDVFKHTTVATIRNDIRALKKSAKLAEIEYQPMVKEILRSSVDSYYAILRPTHRRFLETSDGFDRLQELLAEIDEQLGDPELSHNRAVELITQYERLLSLAPKIAKQARDQTRVTLSIIRALIDMPGKLGLVLESKEVGAHQAAREAMRKAIEDERDPERKKRLIEAEERLADLLQ